MIKNTFNIYNYASLIVIAFLLAAIWFKLFPPAFLPWILIFIILMLIFRIIFRVILIYQDRKPK